MAIAGSGKMAKLAGALGKCSEHGITMRDGFVAGELQSAGERFGGMNGFLFHVAISRRSLTREDFPSCTRGQFAGCNPFALCRNNAPLLCVS